MRGFPSPRLCHAPGRHILTTGTVPDPHAGLPPHLLESGKAARVHADDSKFQAQPMITKTARMPARKAKGMIILVFLPEQGTSRHALA